MGFIDWHGNKQDHYQEVLAFAQMKERLNTENFGSQMKKKADAEFFGTPELASLKTKEVLKLLVKEQKTMGRIYKQLLCDAGADAGGAEIQIYQDAWLYLIVHMIDESALDKTTKEKLADAFLNHILKMENRTSVKLHGQSLQQNSAYQKYVRECFELRSGSPAVFWQWIGYLEQKSFGKEQGQQLARLYQMFSMHFAFYLNQIIPEQEIGKRFAKNRKVHASIIAMSLRDFGSYPALMEKMENPLYCEKLKKQFCDTFKYARMILNNCAVIEDGEKDMIAAGRLYESIKAQKLQKESIASILPQECRSILSSGRVPVIDGKLFGLLLHEGESLHYREHAIVYRQDEKKEEQFYSFRGIVSITNERLHYETGMKTQDIWLKDIGRIILYDAMPEVLVLERSEGPFFMRTANPLETYQLLKLLINGTNAEKETVSMEVSEQEDLPSYIFKIKTMIDSDLPEQMNDALAEMVDALECLDTALEEKPEHQERSYQFFAYYIPEAIRILYAYMEYGRSGLGEDQVNPVYENVLEAVHKVSSAARQQVTDIYKHAITDTTARASALTEILGQDGF